MNVISTRYEASSRYISLKECTIKEYNVEGSKACIGITL
jgi:hypothetical protein